MQAAMATEAAIQAAMSTEAAMAVGRAERVA